MFCDLPSACCPRAALRSSAARWYLILLVSVLALLPRSFSGHPCFVKSLLCGSFSFLTISIAGLSEVEEVLSASGQELFDAGTPPAQTCLSSQFRRLAPSPLCPPDDAHRCRLAQKGISADILRGVIAGRRIAAVDAVPNTRRFSLARRSFAHVWPQLCAGASSCAGSLALHCAWTLLNGACAHGLVLLCVHLRRGLGCRALKCARARVLVPDSESCRCFYFLHPDHACLNKHKYSGTICGVRLHQCSQAPAARSIFFFFARQLAAPSPDGSRAHACFVSQQNNPRPTTVGEMLLSVQFSTYQAFTRTERGVGFPGPRVTLCHWCGAIEPFCMARWNPWFPQGSCQHVWQR